MRTIKRVAVLVVLGFGAGVAAQPTPAPGAAPPPAQPPPAAPTPAPAAPPPAAPAPEAPTPEPAPAPEAPAPAPEPATPPAAPAPPPTPQPAPAPAPDAVSAPLPVAEETVPAEPAEGEAEEMVVTGSRIKQATAFAPSAPVEVIDRKQLAMSGASNLADVVQNLTVSQGTGTLGIGGASGTSGINLRGLGFGATLILINGRRINPSGGGISFHFQDIGTIPLAAVERIEILKGGASAIYGADAVGGVVNIITRKHWDGVRADVDLQTTDRLDQQEYTASVAFGSIGERSRLLLASSYFLRDELRAEQRDITKGQLITQQGRPSSFIVGTGTVHDPACERVPGSMVEMSTSGTICAFSLRPYSELIGNTEQVSAFGSAEYDLTDHTMVFGELSVSRVRVDGRTSPSIPVPPPFPVIPANHVDNPYGQEVRWIGRPVGAEGDEVRNFARDDTFRGVLGLRGDFEAAAEDTFFEDWEWELFMMAGVSSYVMTFHDNLREPLQKALNSCSDPADLSGCFNPFYSSIDGTGTPNRDAVIDSFSGMLINFSDHAMQTYNAGMNGPLFELPGGDAGIAFGTEVRHEWRTTELDHDTNEQNFALLLGNSDASASRNVYGGYLELRLPFYDGIELQTAGRLENYTDTDKTPLSPSVGLTVTPAEIVGRDNVVKALRRLQFRGHATSAFRAPTVYQSFPGFSTLPEGLITEPGGLPSITAVQIRGNPDLNPERALALSAGFLWAPTEQLSLMTDFWHYTYEGRILPPIAQQIIDESLANRVQDPRIIGDLFSSPPLIERIDTQLQNTDGSLVTNGFDFGLLLTFDGADFGGGENDWGTLSAGAQGTYTMNYTIPRGEAGNRITSTETLGPAGCEGEGDTDPCQVAGNHNANVIAPALPRLKANFPIAWTYEGHMASAIAHYISGLDDDIEPNDDGSFDSIDAWFTLDLQYGYTIEDWVGEELTFRIGVYNVADSMPPPVNGRSTVYASEVHDVRGRMVYGKLISEF